MASSLEFWFDYTCPYAYLASTRAAAFGDAMGVRCAFRPMLLGGIFQARGTPQNLSSTLSPAKARHNREDLARWATLFQVKLETPPQHPMRSVDALRITLATDCDPRLIESVYRAYWVHSKNIADEHVLAQLLEEAGHPAQDILAKAKSQEVKDELRKRTERALELGIFGAPSFVVDGRDLYWGQDRMHLVAGMPVETFLEKVVDAKRPEKRSARKVELFFDFSSPYAYIANALAEGLRERTGADLVYQPMFLGGLFRSIGQVDAPILSWSEAKRNYTFMDLIRTTNDVGIPFAFPSTFPVVTVKALRCYLALGEGRRDEFRNAAFRAYWAEGRDISDDAVLADLVGTDWEKVRRRTQEPALKEELIARTKAAQERGVFGVPTWIVDEKELIWGQDRVPLVERALLA